MVNNSHPQTKSKQLATTTTTTSSVLPCRRGYMELLKKKISVSLALPKYTHGTIYTRYSYYDNKTTARKKKNIEYNSHRNNMLITYMFEIFKLISSTRSRILRCIVVYCILLWTVFFLFLLFASEYMFGLYVKACYPRSMYHRNSKIPGTQN